MIYKTILVPLPTKENAKRLAKFAASVAQKFDAHLIGLHTMQQLEIYPGVSVSTQGLDESYRAAQMKISDEIQGVFEDQCENVGVLFEWRSSETKVGKAGQALVQHARCADLVIMGQPDEEHDGYDQENIQRMVIEGAGRPVLVVPKVGTFDAPGNHTLIGWSATKEATRAVHDAIPFMQLGKDTQLLWISASGSKDTLLANSVCEVAKTLDRNGITVEVSRRPVTELPIGDEILNEAADSGADLIVAGAFGHSRIYDFVVGATTPHLMKHMTVPVLFSC